MKKLLLIALLSWLPLSGCVAQSYWMGKVYLPAKPSNYPIEILLPGEIIEHPYQVLGVIQVDGWYGARDESLIRAAQNQARRHGGDALVMGEFGKDIISYRSYSPGDSVETLVTGDSSNDAKSGVLSYAAAVPVPVDPTTKAVAVRAPMPTKVVPASVAWPTISAIILRYTDIAKQNEILTKTKTKGRALK